MSPHLSLSQLSFLVGVVLAVGVVIILIVYFFHRAVREGLGKRDLTESAIRVDDQTAFALAALQGLIGSMKEEQKKTLHSLHATQQLAEDALRKLEVVAQEMEQGLIIFDRQGFIRMANPAIRAVLQIDTWSRRRFPEVLGRDSKLAGMVEDCLRTGRPTRNGSVEHQTARGENRPLSVSVVPLQTQKGTIEGAVCLVEGRQVPPSQQQ
jgi:PAS domain-containing protein